MTERGAVRLPSYPFDWMIIGYCVLMTLLVLIFGRPIVNYAEPLVFYIITGALAFTIMRCVDEKRSRIFEFIRYMYPAILFTFFYSQTGNVIFLLFDHFYDYQLVAFEHAVFGVNPTLYIDQHLLNVWLTEIFHCTYFMYYPMIPAFIIPLFFLRQRRVLAEFMTAASLTYFLSYLLFSLWPIEGPRWHFADLYLHTVDGPVFRQMVNYVIANGAVHGGAMPSSHTGIALVIMMFCFRYYRKFGWILLPIVIGLSIGTFWGRFHYVSDVIVGASIALVSTWLVWWRYNAWTSDQTSTITETRRTEHVA